MIAETYDQELAYIRNRYVANGQFSYHFEHLHHSANDVPRLIREVFNGEEWVPEGIAAAVLNIVCRSRNNLFH